MGIENATWSGRAPREPTTEEIEAMTHMASQVVGLQIDGLCAIYLLAHLQVALRHPENRGPASQSITALAWMLRDEVINREPGLLAICDDGWAGVPLKRSN